MSRLWHFCTIVLLFHQYVLICSASASFSSSFIADLFQNWCQEHGKTYSSEQERQYRLRVLEDNYDYITQHNNKANSTYTLSLNAFADLTHHEFKAKYLLGRSLSPSANDLDSSALLLEAVAAAKPVSIGICGSDRPFQFYSQGIFTGPCCDTLDHAILIVGYDSRNGIEYWNVKNSWGTSWGINGYMHLERKNGNSCGMNREVIRYPLKETNLSPSPSPNPPSPTFVTCDVFTYCQNGETCCCGTSIGKLCIIWNCCPVKSATCCKDRKHCCPPQFPICVDKSNVCRRKNGATTLANPLRNATLHG